MASKMGTAMWWAEQFWKAFDEPFDEQLAALAATDQLPIFDKMDEARRRKVTIAHMAQFCALYKRP